MQVQMDILKNTELAKRLQHNIQTYLPMIPQEFQVMMIDQLGAIKSSNLALDYGRNGTSQGSSDATANADASDDDGQVIGDFKKLNI